MKYKTRRAAAVGKSSPVLAEVLKVGQAVEVSYSDMSGALLFPPPIPISRQRFVNVA